MGSYYIPSNNLKGESRILYIFTAKSLLFTAGGAFIGFIFLLIFSLFGLSTVGWICMALLALLGYGIATIKFPASGNSKLAKNVGGDSIDDVILRYILFKKNKKVYTYSVPRKEPDYTSLSDKLSMDSIMKNITTPKEKNNTKEGK